MTPSGYVVYYESRKRELKKRRKNEDRCDERLKLKRRNLHVSHALCLFIMNQQSVGCVYYESIK